MWKHYTGKVDERTNRCKRVFAEAGEEIKGCPVRLDVTSDGWKVRAAPPADNLFTIARGTTPSFTVELANPWVLSSLEHTEMANVCR
ncbi:hypothetical protein E2C01_032508 [Portunus trituberculatus]|uniref:Uncharacterized protein n=1 Tax=Portunus trituberculatus TaxID=210409 RepID=A0A5B7F175_PORTR|nr:hypothetical protein [Portunus trituberculatus]